MFGVLTEEHRRWAHELRDAVKDNAAFQQLQQGGSDADDLTSDFRLVRIVQSRNGKLADAKKMLEDHLVWRESNNAAAIRAQVAGKPVQTASLPHAAFFEPALAGCWNTIASAGLSRSGDVVHVEAMGLQRVGGGKGGMTSLDVHDEQVMDKLSQHLIGFFEQRSIQLERLSQQQGKLVRTLQIRDVSRVAFVPSSSLVALVKRIINLGMLNYPEIGAFVVFVNPPAVFQTVFSIVKVFIPADVDKKLRFLSGQGDYVPRELLRYVRPRHVVAWNRLNQGLQSGDEVQRDIEELGAAWERVEERQVGARAQDVLCFALERGRTTCIQWSSSSTSGITASVYHVSAEHEHLAAAKDVDVLLAASSVDNNRATLPPGASEALVVLLLDNSSSWLQGKTFQLTVKGSASVT